MENEIHINIPEGMEIDKENSTFECIKFRPKPKKLTYWDICTYLNIHGYCYTNINVNTIVHIEKFKAIGKLINVAYYLNNGWKPNWEDQEELKWTLYINKNGVEPDYTNCHSACVYFKTRKLARQAIDILGEGTIRLALSTN